MSLPLTYDANTYVISYSEEELRNVCTTILFTACSGLMTFYYIRLVRLYYYWKKWRNFVKFQNDSATQMSTKMFKTNYDFETHIETMDKRKSQPYGYIRHGNNEEYVLLNCYFYAFYIKRVELEKSIFLMNSTLLKEEDSFKYCSKSLTRSTTTLKNLDQMDKITETCDFQSDSSKRKRIS